MLYLDLAALYEVSTKILKQAVKRHADRMGLRHAPMAFTEQGVAMLSSVLKA